MKILHIGEYVKGGVATYIDNVLDYQTKNDSIESVGLILSENKSENFSNYSNIYRYKYKRNPMYFINAIYKIHQYIRKFNPDIIHVHSTFAGLFVRLPLLFIKKKYKIVYCSHGWSFLMDNSSLKDKIFTFIEKTLSKKTDLIINISENELNNSLLRNFPKSKSVVIQNGVNDEFNSQIEEINIDKREMNWLYVGRLDHQKGIDILIDYFDKYKPNKSNLYVVGEGVLSKNQYKSQSSSNIHFLGWVENSKLDTYYKLADAVIMPSRWEGFGLVAIEAMKNKTPVVASNRGALTEIVVDKYNGRIFDIDNLDSLDYILRTTSKEDYLEMGMNGRNTFETKFTSEKMNKKIIENYKNIYKN